MQQRRRVQTRRNTRMTGSGWAGAGAGGGGDNLTGRAPVKQIRIESSKWTKEGKLRNVNNDESKMNKINKYSI
jgi:hypothetical protein